MTIPIHYGNQNGIIEYKYDDVKLLNLFWSKYLKNISNDIMEYISFLSPIHFKTFTLTPDFYLLSINNTTIPIILRNKKYFEDLLRAK